MKHPIIRASILILLRILYFGLNVSSQQTGEITTDPVIPSEVEGSLSGIQTIPTPIPKLSISEIFFDGSDEWIEISNLGEGDFSGNLFIQGGGIDKDIFLVIPKLSSIVISRLGRSMAIIQDQSVIQTGTSMGFTDTKAINLGLIISGQVIDSFDVDTGAVNYLNDKKTSFQKEYIGETHIITGTKEPQNISPSYSEYVATPGRYITTTTVSSPPLSTGSNPETYDDSVIKITEIYYTDGQYPSFIEIQAFQDINEELFLSGTLLKENLFVGTTLEKHEIMIISPSDNLWLSDQKMIKNTRLDLNSSGFLQISRQSGQVLDKINVLFSFSGKSLYNSGLSQNIDRTLAKVDSFSPGFPEKFLSYYKGIESQSGTIISIQNQPVFPPPNPSPPEAIVHPGAILITDIQAFGTESITLQSKIDQEIDFSQKKYYLQIQSSGSTSAGTKRYIYNTLPGQSTKTFSQSFGFSDQGACISLIGESGVIDKKCYSAKIESNTPTTSKQKETTLTGQDETENMLIPQVKILSLLPNPVGKDTNETITFLFSGDSPGVTLSKDRYLLINKTKKYLSGFLNSGIPTTLTGNFTFPNTKASCVQLFYKTNILDKFCYDPPKEGQEIGKTNTGLQSIDSVILQTLNQVSFQTTGNKICIQYQKQLLTCRNLPASKTSLKLKNQNQHYKQVLNFLQSYVSNNRPTLYNQTPLGQYIEIGLKNIEVSLDYNVILLINDYIDALLNPDADLS